MAEGNRPLQLTRHRLPWFQQIHQNSSEFVNTAAQQINTATQHINELSDYIRHFPLNTPTQNPPTRPPRVSGDETMTANPPSRVAPNVGNQEYFVIDIENAPVTEPTVNALDQETGNQSDPEQAGNLRNQPELQALIAFAEKYVPFLLILLLKLIFDHRIGILVNLGLFTTFCHANTVIKKEVSKQGKWSLKNLVLICLNLILSISLIYTLLADYTLAYALVFIPPYSSPIDFWEVLWIISVTDFVLRLLTILVKVIFVAIPARMIAFPKKGKYYLFTERSSQLYRTIIPMQHWLYFFSESYSGPSKVFGIILSAAYFIFKVKSIIKKGKLWKKTLVKVLQSKTYGVTPSNNQIKAAGDACPICQDDYKCPSMLQCKHIFCEECVALWFDRERTCPICRAQIADDPIWRDGSTTLLHQIF